MSLDIGLNIQKSIIKRNVIPSVYTVPSGTYYSNCVYGSGKPQVNTYKSVLDRSYSNITIRQHDKSILFNIQIALDLTVPAPFIVLPIFPSEEIRINYLSPSNPLPLPDEIYNNPLFDTEIILSNNSAPAIPGFAPGILKARLLYGGNLALISYDPLVQSDYIVTAGEFFPLFNSAVPNQKLLIKINGSYTKQNMF